MSFPAFVIPDRNGFLSGYSRPKNDYALEFSGTSMQKNDALGARKSVFYQRKAIVDTSKLSSRQKGIISGLIRRFQNWAKLNYLHVCTERIQRIARGRAARNRLRRPRV